MPGYTLPLTESRIIADLMKRQRGISTGIVDSGGLSYQWEKDSWRVVSPPATTYTLSFLPVQNSVDLTLNGLTLVEGTSYTVDYTTGVLTVSFTLTAEDVLAAEYVTTGDLTAQKTAVPNTYAGAANNWQSSAVWSMSAMQIGKRVSGTWTYTSETPPAAASGVLMVDEGIADAYSSETTIASPIPATDVLFGWRAGHAVSDRAATNTGVELQINPGHGMTLYLWRKNAIVLSQLITYTPAVGDVVRVVSDFTANAAAAYVNGIQVGTTMDLSGQTWYTQDGTLT